MAHYQVIIERLQQLKREIPVIVGNEMVNFAIDNIHAEGFEGDKWDPRKPGAPRNNGRGLLKDTGDGERSIRVSREDESEVHVTANDYMEAHNTGATIRGNFSVREHTRKRRGRSMTVKAHSRNVNTTLPTRTFLAPSKTLNTRIATAIVKRFRILIS